MREIYNRYIQYSSVPQEAPPPKNPPPPEKGGGLGSFLSKIKLDKSEMLLLALLCILCLKDGEEPENLLILAAIFLLT